MFFKNKILFFFIININFNLICSTTKSFISDKNYYNIFRCVPLKYNIKCSILKYENKNSQQLLDKLQKEYKYNTPYVINHVFMKKFQKNYNQRLNESFFKKILIENSEEYSFGNHTDIINITDEKFNKSSLHFFNYFTEILWQNKFKAKEEELNKKNKELEETKTKEEELEKE